MDTAGADALAVDSTRLEAAALPTDGSPKPDDGLVGSDAAGDGPPIAPDGTWASPDGPSPASDTPSPRDVFDADAPTPDAPAADGPAPDAPGTCPTNKVSCNGVCIDPAPGGCCVASDCAGTCMTCGTDHVCAPAKGQADPSGHCAGTCDATGACKSKQGQTCDTVAGGCVSGSTCVDGYCCDKPCTGSCEACNVAGSAGTCTTLAKGAAPQGGSHLACAGAGTTCGGTCDGISASCTYGTGSCGTATCTGSVYQAAGTCSQGTCVPGNQQTCTNACVVSAGGCADCSPSAAPRCNPASGVPQKCSASGVWQDQTACTGGLTCSAGNCTCAAPKTTCGSACVDVQSDPANCGRCGHDCLGGTCTAGQCQPVPILSGSTLGRPGVFGVDDSQIYFWADDPQNLGNTIAYQAGKRLTGSTTAPTPLDNGRFVTFDGVIGTKILLHGQYDKMTCDVSNCTGTIASLPGKDANLNTLPAARFHSPAPRYIAQYDGVSSNSQMSISWYSTAGSLITTYRDPVVFSGTADWNSQFAFGDSVYWIRNLYDVGGTRLDTSVYSTNVSNSAMAPMHLAGSLTTSMTLVDANAQSLLLQGSANLYRVPLPNGLGSQVPQPLTALATVGSNVLVATEDATGVYWIDIDGTMYHCAISSGACTGKQVLANGQSQTYGYLYQDDAALYWANTNPGQVMRLAK